MVLLATKARPAGTTELSEIEFEGPALSTLTFVTVADVKVLPTLSVVTTRRSYRPSVTAVVSQPTEYGVVASLEIVVHVPVPAGELWNVAELTPDAASAEFEEIATAAPWTFALDAGTVSDPVGLVESFVNVTVVVVEV